MQLIYQSLSRFFFLAATLLLMALALALLAFSAWSAVEGVMAGQRSMAALDAIAVLIISFAVMETGSFIAEEEVMRKRELRSTQESRRSITKFITIIVIAMSLEALVMVFRASAEDISKTIYPAVLFAVAMFALVALGIYQWLSSRIGDTAEQADDIPQGDSDEGNAH